MGVILPELREGHLGNGSNTTWHRYTRKVMDKVRSGCAKGGGPMGQGVLECLKAKGNLGHGVLGHIGP